MENINIYESIGKRTGGDIYIGVVGSVRAGKSTFIKRFMELMVLPSVKDIYEKERMLDEMPQSGTGRTVTTTEPKFVSADAAELSLPGNMQVRVRLVDCARASEDDMDSIMGMLLDRFPVREVVFRMPGYMEGLERDHWLKSGIVENIKHWADSFSTAGDIRKVTGDLADGQMVESAEICMADMGTGEISIRLNMAGNLYYRIITELMGENVTNDHDFFTMLREFATVNCRINL